MTTMRAVLASWFAPLLIHGQNQAMAAQRAAYAKGMGLDNPTQYGVPYPGNTSTTTNNVKGGGWLPGALVTAAALTLGGAGVYALLAQKPAPATAKTPQPAGPVVADPIGPPAGLWKQMVSYDGGKTWQEEQSQKATKNADGTWSTPDGRKWRQDAAGDWGETK